MSMCSIFKSWWAGPGGSPIIPAILEAETGGSWVSGQPNLHKTLSQKQKKSGEFLGKNNHIPKELNESNLICQLYIQFFS
jgi:hypothetical protein